MDKSEREDQDFATEENCGRFRVYFRNQIRRLVALEAKLRPFKEEKLSELHPLLASIVEDAISIELLASEYRVNDSYIIGRALLERLANYCYLQLCDEDDYARFVRYSKQKGVRRLDRSLERGGQKVELRYMGEVNLDEYPDLKKAYEEFTGEKGGEKTRWTTNEG